MKNFDFNNLFVLDLANNHQGDMQHALQIIDMLGDVVNRLGTRAAIKFQFRQLDSFIHNDFKERKDIKHIPRFMETALDKEQYRELTQAIVNKGMETICTPFDEESIPIIDELGIGIIKVASCSANDWPLLEAVSKANKPVIASTAGLSLQDIDKLVSFFERRNVDFALMHCVAIYPTPDEKLQLNQIDFLKNRYLNLTIGFSTHEDQNNFDAVKIAYAKGARIFERHVGLEANGHQLNLYSSNPDQIEKWVASVLQTKVMCGSENRAPAGQLETDSLATLARGIYIKSPVKAGEEITRENVYFAMPLQADQLTSSSWRSGMVAEIDYDENMPVSKSLDSNETTDEECVFSILLQVKGLLNQARICIGKNSSVEISHHYGLKRFREFGAVIIDCVNREYCKKLIVMLPRQKHPYHFHKKKEETFQLLSGDLEVEKNGETYTLSPGDTLLIGPQEWHKFHTLSGAIFEEISTTHYNNDSFYEDKKIAGMSRDMRKTKIPNSKL